MDTGNSSRLIIFAMGLSDPSTMGGNSKIAIETARCLAARQDVHFVVPASKVETLAKAVPDTSKIKIHPVESFPGSDKYHPWASVRHYLPKVREVFRSLDIGENDIVFGISDFHVDVIPLYRLQSEFGFRWLPSVFLFIPTPFENLAKSYRFPLLKYAVYWAYQRILFLLMLRKASGFVLTNETDQFHLPKRFRHRFFAYYGGVNVEQIPTAQLPKRRDVVFCSRLHPQKGIDGFLDVWAMVSKQCPQARFTVIGNGDSAYEARLQAKARRLGIADSVEWLGYVNGPRKFEIYRESRLLVHATIFDNNGMVAAEALCSGLPVVMYDLPSLRNVYDTGCLKIPYGDKARFAAALSKLLQNPSEIERLAPSLEDVDSLRHRWMWETRCEELAAFLEKLSEL